VYWVDTFVLQLPLQAVDVRAQARVLALKVLRMATGAGEACDAVCCTTFGVVLRARRAAAGLRVAADLPGLWVVLVSEWSLDVWMYGCMDACHGVGTAVEQTAHTHLAPVACLPSAARQALLPRARTLAGVLRVVVDVQVVARGLGRHVMMGAVLAVVVVVVHGALHRHGAVVVVLRRLAGGLAGLGVLGVFRLTLRDGGWRMATPLIKRLSRGPERSYVDLQARQRLIAAIDALPGKKSGNSPQACSHPQASQPAHPAHPARQPGDLRLLDADTSAATAIAQ
jgi:hypothetical protein